MRAAAAEEVAEAAFLLQQYAHDLARGCGLAEVLADPGDDRLLVRSTARCRAGRCLVRPSRFRSTAQVWVWEYRIPVTRSIT
jgi:hypothetical protein